MADFNTRMLGIAQIRQLRIDESSCDVPDEMVFLNISCHPEYSKSTDGDFVAKDVSEGMLDFIWKKQTAYETGSRSTFGNLKKNNCSNV